MKIQTVSSRWTFLFKLALPVFWLIVMGGVSIIILFSPLKNVQEPFDPISAKFTVVSFFVSILVFLYFLFGKAKWVGASDTHLYVSNFFKSYKYTYSSIARIEEENLIFFKRVVLHFHQPTKFGKSIYFVKSHYWKYFLEKHPAVLDAMTGKTDAPKVVSEEPNQNT